MALLGSNGAGKTTTLKAISGLLRSEEGEVTDGGIFFEGQPHARAAARGRWSGAASSRSWRGAASSRTSPSTRTSTWGATPATTGPACARDKEACLRLLPPPQGAPEEAGRLPLRRRAADARHQPRAHGAPQAHDARRAVAGARPAAGRRRSSASSSASTRSEKTTILLVEQNANLALSIADYGYIMENGRVVLDGDPEKLRSNEDVKEFYLGGGGEAARRATRTSSSTSAASAGLASGLRRAGATRDHARRLPPALRPRIPTAASASPRRPGAPSRASGSAAPWPTPSPAPRAPAARSRPPASTRPPSTASTTSSASRSPARTRCPAAAGRGAALRRPHRASTPASWPASSCRPAPSTTRRAPHDDFWRFRHALAVGRLPRRRRGPQLGLLPPHPARLHARRRGPGAGLRGHPRRRRPDRASGQGRRARAGHRLPRHSPASCTRCSRRRARPARRSPSRRPSSSPRCCPSRCAARSRTGSGCGCLQGYGTADLGCLAYECPEKGGWHVHPEAIVEVLDLETGKPAGPGPARRGGGHALRRGLSAAPLRHRRPRRRSAPEERCGCGRTTPKLLGLLGRVGDGVKVKGMFIRAGQIDGVMKRFAEVTRLAGGGDPREPPRPARVRGRALRPRRRRAPWPRAWPRRCATR